MTDNIKPEHYRKGEIDLFESWYLTYPFEQYRAIMQAIAERYMRRDKNDRVEDLGKSIYTLERLKEKEVEHREKQEKVKSNKTLKELFTDMGIDFDEFMRKHTKEDTLKKLWSVGYRYLARNKDGHLYAYDDSPVKFEDAGYWDVHNDLDSGLVFRRHYFPEVKWSDEEPTTIAGLLYIYGNGGESGDLED